MGMLTACEPDFRLLDPQDLDTAGMRTVEVHVVLAVPALADSLAWPEGVPNALVHHTPTAQQRYRWTSARADTMGGALFPIDHLGVHWLAAEVLGPDTMSGPAVFAGGSDVMVTTGAGAVRASVQLHAPTTGTLVISEVFLQEPPIWEVSTKGETKYVELYNNSDRIFHLDGMIVGKAYHPWFDTSAYGHHSCVATAPWRLATDALWADAIWQFPGSGAEHPVGPGETVLIAVSATDNRVRHPTFQDLRHADFEFMLPDLADNPAVPNMEYEGTRRALDNDFLLNNAFWFLAERLDVASLPLAPDPAASAYVWNWRAVPAPRVIDAVVIWFDMTNAYTQYRSTTSLCQPAVNPLWDRLPGGFLTDEELTASAQRRVLPGTDGTRLLDTNTSFVDFEVRERTPGWVGR